MLPSLEAAELPADAIEVGRIADAWGIKGWFKVLPHSAQPEALFSSKRWFLQAPGAAANAAFRLAIREAKEHSDCIVASSEDVPDRNAAERLRGLELTVPRSALPPLEEGEYYHADLLGLPCVSTSGEALGIVVAIDNFGAGDVIEVERPDTKRFMVPMRAEAVPDWNDERLVVDEAFIT